MPTNELFTLKIWVRISQLTKWLYHRENFILLSPTKKQMVKKGSLVAIVAGTKADQVIEHINKIDYKKRSSIKEITLDMANSLKLISKRCFPRAIQVTDRFTLIFYLNFGCRDITSLNSCSKINFRSFTRN